MIAGKYRLVRMLGDGGMGSVYEAEHTMLGTSVALKLIHEDLLARTGLMDRFVQEARVVAQIRSQHVVRVLDVDKIAANGQAYIVMELLQGESLGALLNREHQLQQTQAVDVVLQILEGLEAAHVVHRDLKPDNIFITPDSRLGLHATVIDFGIAKLRTVGQASSNMTMAGSVMGTAEYMAPEQAFSADQADPRSDIYALGILFYEALSGKRPVSGDDPRVIAAKVAHGDAVPLLSVAPHVSPQVAALVHRAMAPKPEARFQSAREMRDALAALRDRMTAAAPIAMPAQAGTASMTSNELQAPSMRASVRPPGPPGSPAPQDASTNRPGGVQNAAPRQGTGTMMEAPVPAALASAIYTNRQTMAGDPGFVPAPVLAHAGPPSPAPYSPTPAYSPAPAYAPAQTGGQTGGLRTGAPQQQGGGSSMVWVLAAFLVLCGLFGLGAYLYQAGVFDSPTNVGGPTVSPDPAVATPSVPSATAVRATTAVPALPTLTPGKDSPAVPTQPQTKDAGARPAPSQTATGPGPLPGMSGLVLPTAMPPMPTVLPTVLHLPGFGPPQPSPQPSHSGGL
jgi:eukaryotic-like serine/threonine-protein kinase